MSGSSPAEAWAGLLQSWMPLAFAPQKLSQSIDSGWSFGNVTINERNSSAPGTEQAILADESYGRQIGKLLDAVCDLVKAQPGYQTNPAFADIVTLKTKIDGLKRAAALKRVDQLRRDLELLSKSDKPDDQAAYQQSIAALRGLLLEPAGKAG